MAASGFLKNRDIMPFERTSVLELNLAVQWYCRNRLREQVHQNLLASLATQVSAAALKSQGYREVAETVRTVLEQSKDLLFLGTLSGPAEKNHSWIGELKEFYESYWGESIEGS
jgi:hypothetical protein